MGKRLNLTGKVFGKFTVVRDKGNNKHRESMWECRCLCGKIFTIVGKSLTSGNSMGCAFCKNVKHGLARVGKVTREFRMWNSAKQNAKVADRLFEIQLDDIVIPEFCPLLGIRLDKNAALQSDNLPSLDRINSQLGYTSDNIWVVSWRANRIKSDLDLFELKLLVENLEAKLTEQKIYEARQIENLRKPR